MKQQIQIAASFFLLSGLLIFMGQSDGIALEKITISHISPFYKVLPKQPVQNLNKILSSCSSPMECRSDEEFKSILGENYNNRVNQFVIHLVYDFLFEEVSDKLRQTHDSIMAANDYLHLSYQAYNLSYCGYDGDVTVDYTVTYLTTLEEEQIVTQRIDEILSDQITPGMDDTQKIKQIHDWIVLNLEYDMSDTHYTAYSALITGRALCQGYSLLTYKMLNQAGIPAKIVNSEAMDHSWNMVAVCKNWYHIDCGWDDPVPDEPGRVVYNYYLMSDDEFLNHEKNKHTWITGSYPVAPQAYQGDICYDQNPLSNSYLTQTQISQLYVAIFGRASEGDGNAYWMSNQDDMVEAANTMLQTDPAKEYFGESLENNQMFIEFIYENTLGKTYEEDPDGVNYWVGELGQNKSKGEVIATLINAVMDPQFAGMAAQNQFMNRVAVSNYTAETIDTVPDVTDLSAFVAFISNVTHDPDTVTAARAMVDNQ